MSCTLIKTTTSLCPHCLIPLPAQVRMRGQQVWLDKECPEHGPMSALLAADRSHYYAYDPDAVGTAPYCCGPSGGCGEGGTNHSCNLLIEITDRCNLTCPTCYATSSPQGTWQMSLEDFEGLLDRLLAQGKAGADLIQLSGGEPTLHPDLLAMIEQALARGFRQIYLNTNGLRLATPSFTQRLAAWGPKVSIYLQFDGFDSRVWQGLRGREDLLEVKLRALDCCEQEGLRVVPVMTATPGLNDGELGAFLRMASSRPGVDKVMIHPAMYSGRYLNPKLVERLTVADVVRLVCQQTEGLFTPEDFTPIPCADPNCFCMALALRGAQGLMPVSRYLPRYSRWKEPGIGPMLASVADSFDNPQGLRDVLAGSLAAPTLAALDEAALDALLETLAATPSQGWGGLFAIGIKPFMDAFSYDQDRIDRCCVHIVSRSGQPVSFCEYNALWRPQGRL